MDLIHVVVYLILVGVGLWVVNQIEQIDPKIKRIINIAVIVLVVVWLLLDVAVPLLEDSSPGYHRHW